jgi:hypothetical protein
MREFIANGEGTRSWKETGRTRNRTRRGRRVPMEGRPEKRNVRNNWRAWVDPR